MTTLERIFEYYGSDGIADADEDTLAISQILADHDEAQRATISRLERELAEAKNVVAYYQGKYKPVSDVLEELRQAIKQEESNE